MGKLIFKIDIHAPKEVVWNVLWSKKTYPQWTSVFGEGSRAISDWKEGSKIFFLSPNNNGMYGIIDKLVPNRQITIRHIGILSGGIEQPTGEQTADVEGDTESYYLNEKEDLTELVAELYSTDDYTRYFEDTFPKALQIVKELSEKVPAAV